MTHPETPTAASGLPDPDRLWSIEDAVDEVPFLGISMGASLNDFLLHLALDAHVNPLLEMVRTVRMGLPSPQRKTPQVSPEGRGRILFTWMRDTPRMSDLVLPVIRELGPRSCAVLGSQLSMRSRLPEGCDFYLENDLGPQRWARWAAEFTRVGPRWLAALRRVLAEQSLPLSIAPLLLTALVQQSRQLTTFLGALEVIRPRAVVADFDRGSFASPLVLAARALGIPTVTMVHGAVSLRGYTPLIADVALCWGEDQVEVFVRAGAPPDRLVITGCHRSALCESPDSEAVRRRLGLAPDRDVVVLATVSGPPLAERLRYARVFCEAMAGHPDVAAVLRVHPVERVEDYAALVRDHPFLRVIDDRAASTTETLAVASLLVCGESTIAADAVLLGCPVVLLELDGTLLDGSRLAMGGEGPVVHDVGALASIVDRFFGTRDFRDHLVDMARRHAPRVCAALGPEAAGNAAAEIERRAASGYGGEVSDIGGRRAGRVRA